MEQRDRRPAGRAAAGSLRPWADQEDEAKTAHLTAVLKPYGIKVGQVYRTVEGRGMNRRGITRGDVVEAAPKRIRRVK